MSAAMSISLRLLAGIAAGEGEIALEHALISSTSLFSASISGDVLDQRELELEAGQDGAQVVADAGEHRGALLDLALDAPAHLDEGQRGLAHLAGAARTEVGPRRPLPKLFRGLGELRGWGGSGCAGSRWRRRSGPATYHHPDEEDVRVRGVGLAAAGEDAQHAGLELRCGSRPGRTRRPCRSRTAGRSACGSRAVASVEEREERRGPGGGSGSGGSIETMRPSARAAMRDQPLVVRRPGDRSR